ncbi:MAG TPA: DNA alkylation repair protein [Polyangiales bacterium]|nr:DNA alkylation repair protein [Polyangiales bacterium]
MPRDHLGVAISLAQMIAARLDALPQHDAATLHRLRRELSKRFADEEPDVVVATALQLLEAPPRAGAKMIAYALVGHHPGALSEMNGELLQRMGSGLASWGDVDMFCCLLAGRAWRAGAISDAVVKGWAKSKDRFWRRAALVATVPLNVRAQGGQGDTRRTIAICRLLVRDPDDTVVKAMSWALRELSARDPESVASFVTSHEAQLAARVKREVKNKLATGLKTGRGRG